MRAGSYYYGYTLTQPFTGSIANKFDAAKLITGGTAMAIVLTVLTPIAAEVHFGLLMMVRALIGMAHGPFNTCLYIMFANWTPKQERATALAGTRGGIDSRR